MTRLWDKGTPLDDRVLSYTAGEDYGLDERLVRYDVRASIAGDAGSLAFQFALVSPVREVAKVAAAGAELILFTTVFDQAEQAARLAAEVMPRLG